MKESEIKYVWYPHRVSYGETDAMQVVYYAEYFHIFERARSYYLRELGVSYKEIEEKGIFLPAREVTCRYRKSAKYEDLLLVKTWISSWSKASASFTYEVYDENKTTLFATSITQHAFVNKEGKPVAIPEWFKEYFNLK